MVQSLHVKDRWRSKYLPVSTGAQGNRVTRPAEVLDRLRGT